MFPCSSDKRPILLPKLARIPCCVISLRCRERWRSSKVWKFLPLIYFSFLLTYIAFLLIFIHFRFYISTFCFYISNFCFYIFTFLNIFPLSVYIFSLSLLYSLFFIYFHFLFYIYFSLFISHLALTGFRIIRRKSSKTFFSLILIWLLMFHYLLELLGISITQCCTKVLIVPFNTVAIISLELKCNAHIIES